MAGVGAKTQANTAIGLNVALTFSDPDHSDEEDRFLTFGHSSEGEKSWIVVQRTARRVILAYAPCPT